jgi:hypothetical protein
MFRLYWLHLANLMYNRAFVVEKSYVFIECAPKGA